MRCLLRTFRDGQDERRARRLRVDFGRRRWLLSWQFQGDGSWLARLSCPTLPETQERHGPTRCEAIRRAEQSLARRLADLV